MIDYLVIGHMTRDLLPDGRLNPGGTALYAATTAARLGKRAGILTSGDPEQLPDPPEGVDLATVRSPAITTFENRYGPDGRVQLLHAVGAPISLTALPAAWRIAPIVHLGPLCNEFSFDLIAAFPGALVGVTPQGWMRGWRTPPPSRVRRVHWRPDPVLLRQVGALVLSIEDVEGDESVARGYAEHCPLVALTRGEQGATLYLDGTPHLVPAPQAAEREPTGAGDVFTAALLIRLYETGDPLAAAAFACAVAACAVEGPGTSCIPSRAEAEVRLRNELKSVDLPH